MGSTARGRKIYIGRTHPPKQEKIRKMYVTRPLSRFTRSLEAAAVAIPPPDGPNSGYLVVADEEYEVEVTRCWGLCKDTGIRGLPFPQNKVLAVTYSDGTTTYTDKTYLIPVLNQPPSSNRYYVIRADGKHGGNACTCSTEEDLGTCCFCTYVNDVKPRPLDHRDVYQQMEIVPRKWGTFVAKSVAPDGFPPDFLRREGWSLHASTPKDFQLGEAHGVDDALRSRLPPFDFPISSKHSTSVVVGKWYVPFVFVNEDGISLKNQVKQSVYYEMCLEQLWEEFHSRDKYAGVEGKFVAVSMKVSREGATVFGEEAVANVVDGVMWLRGGVSSRGVGLSSVVVDRMKWEAGRGGWIDGIERDVKVERVEECGEANEWRKLGCYMLVERFVLKRLDGNVLLTYDFKHYNTIRSKWEC